MNIILSVKNKAISDIAHESGLALYFNQKPLPRNIDILIRWGSTKKADARVTWNPTKAIWKSTNKKFCRELLAQEGIPVPRMGEDKFPCIARPTKHARGQKFIVCRSREDVLRARRKGCSYFSEFYPKRHEYRVHIGSGKILFISEKIGGNHPFVWNHGKGYIFKPLRRHEFRPEVYRPAKAALKALGLDFGAVDVMTDAIGDFPVAVVSEVNTAPAGSPYMIRKYVEYFKEILKQ